VHDLVINNGMINDGSGNKRYRGGLAVDGDHIEDAVRETIDIARASGAPAEIHHLKPLGRAHVCQWLRGHVMLRIILA
jgi:hypothetical protein